MKILVSAILGVLLASFAIDMYDRHQLLVEKEQKQRAMQEAVVKFNERQKAIEAQDREFLKKIRESSVKTHKQMDDLIKDDHYMDRMNSSK